MAHISHLVCTRYCSFTFYLLGGLCIYAYYVNVSTGHILLCVYTGSCNKKIYLKEKGIWATDCFDSGR